VELVSKISNLCDPDPPTSQTDRQTDGRHAISILRYALVHRAVKTEVENLQNAGHKIICHVVINGTFGRGLKRQTKCL